MITALLISTGSANAAPEVQVLTHTRAVHGQTIPVVIEVKNPDASPVNFPDLTNRPWLVQFETVDPSGTRRTLFSTPPDVDPGQEWTIAPDGMRRTSFEVPTSDTWRPGLSRVQVTIVDAKMPPRGIEIVTLEAHHVDQLGAPVDLQSRTPSSLLSVPVAQSTELWLAEGGRTIFLQQVEGMVSAELSTARTEQRIGRWITWTDASGQLWASRMGDKPFPIRLPWPHTEKCGRAATDGSSRLVLPVCVRSPRGETDQLIAAVIEGPTSPTLRTVTRFKPMSLLTNVNAAGHVDWALVRPHAIDHAQIAHTDAHSRPVRISPLWRGASDETLSGATWVMTDQPAVRLMRADGTPSPPPLPLTGSSHQK